MGKIWDYISVQGKTVISTKTIVEVISVALAIFHFILMIFFAFFGLGYLIALNVFSIVVYILGYVAVKKGISAFVVFNIIYAEIVFYSVASTMLVGIECGFLLYLIAIIPLGYYVAYTFREETTNINPMVYVIVTVVAFWTTRVANRFIEPPYSLGNVIIDRAVYMFNYTSILVAILFFCTTVLSKVKVLEERQRLHTKTLEELSKLDPLTGLSNRRSIQERYELAESLHESYAVILGDIDDFKMVNDTYGHDIGDEVLKQVAEVFKSVVRGDDVVCRWGGEEILVFLPNATEEQALAVADRIISRIRDIRIITKASDNFGITMTLGVAVSEENIKFSEIAKKADERLYKGKRTGKNRIVNN